MLGHLGYFVSNLEAVLKCNHDRSQGLHGQRQAESLGSCQRVPCKGCSSPKRRFERPIHLQTQTSDLNEIVHLAERPTMPGEETFHGFLCPLLTMKDRPSQERRGRSQIVLSLAQVIGGADKPRSGLGHELRVMLHRALFLPTARSPAASRQPGPDA